MTAHSDPIRLAVGGAQIRLQNVRLRADITLDEVHFDGSDIRLDAPGVGEQSNEIVTLSTSETKFHVMISEPNINALLDANIPADAPVRGLRVALLSGKVRVTGHVVKSVLHLPFTLEAIPEIVNGTRVALDCQTAKLGFALPAVVVELLEQHINNNPKLPLDLSRLPVPVRLDEIRCEPGRLYVTGRTKLLWPQPVVPPAVAPFSARETPTYLLPQSATSTLPAGDEPVPALPSA
jgi:hypothetical protein